MKAAREVGIDEVPAIVKEYDSKEEEIYALVMDNANQRERTPPQKWREAQAIEPHIEEQKEQNSLSNLKQGNEDPDRPNLDTREEGRTDEIIAKQVGLGGKSTYYKIKRVMQAAENGDETAQEQVVELESREQSIHGAYTTVREEQEGEEGESTAYFS